MSHITEESTQNQDSKLTSLSLNTVIALSIALMSYGVIVFVIQLFYLAKGL